MENGRTPSHQGRETFSPSQRGRLSGGKGKTKKEEGRMENGEKTFPLLHFRGKNNLLALEGRGLR